MDRKLPDSRGSNKDQARPFVFAPSEALDKPSNRLRGWLSNWPLLLIFLFLISLSGAYLFTVFPDWRHLTSVLFWPPQETMETKLPAQSEMAKPMDLIAKLPIDLRKDLMSQDVQSTAQFSRYFVHPIARICDALSATGVGHFSVSLNPVSGNRKVCTGDVVPIGEETSDAGASSIFVWALGSDDDAIEMFRIKVNLTNLQSAEATKDAALVVLKRLHTELSWDLPPKVESGLRDMKDASVSYFGINYQLTREWSSVPRLNIVIRPKDLSGVLSNEGFQRIVGAAPTSRLALKPNSRRTPSARPSNPEPPVGDKTEPIENLYR